MQTLTYSQAAAAAVCFSNLASLTGAACAHTHIHTLLLSTLSSASAAVTCSTDLFSVSLKTSDARGRTASAQATPPVNFTSRCLL